VILAACLKQCLNYIIKILIGKTMNLTDSQMFKKIIKHIHLKPTVKIRNSSGIKNKLKKLSPLLLNASFWRLDY